MARRFAVSGPHTRCILHWLQGGSRSYICSDHRNWSNLDVALTIAGTRLGAKGFMRDAQITGYPIPCPGIPGLSPEGTGS